MALTPRSSVRLERKCPLVALALTVSFFAGPVQAQDRLAGLSAYIESGLEDWGLPGLAVAVVLHDEVVFAEGFGVKQMGRSDPIDARTRFQIGSTTKAFAAAAVGALVDDGRVGWDDPVARHIPWFRVQDPWVTRNATLRDLLTHRSGMPGHAFVALELVDARTAAERIRFLTNQGPFRQDYRYSNQAYGLTGLIVEEVTGQPWGSWVRSRILQPLQMNDSGTSPYDLWEPEFVAPTFLGTAPAGTVDLDDATAVNVAMPHGVDREGNRRVLPWQSYDNLQAAGSMVSTVLDMANWLRMHLGEGSFAGTEVLSPETVAELHAPQIRTTGTFLFADEGPTSYALGWTRQRFQGNVYLSHGGGIFGFPAYVAMLPERGAGVVVLANGSTWTPYYPHQDIVAWVLSHLLDLEQRDWHGETMERTGVILDQVAAAYAAQDAARIPDTAPSLGLDGYAGTYGSDEGGPLTVSAVRAGLRLAFAGTGAFSGELEHWHHDVFRLWFDGGDGQAYSHSLVTFTIGPRGEVAELDLGAFGVYRRCPPPPGGSITPGPTAPPRGCPSSTPPA